MLSDYPRWRAFLQQAGDHLEANKGDDDPLKRLAGALAFVRQGVPTKVEETLSQEQHLDTELELRDVGGEQTLHFTLEDPQLGDIACRIQKTEQGISAVFQARDINTERLLTAELGRLRVQLESRGLRVGEMLVERSG